MPPGVAKAHAENVCAVQAATSSGLPVPQFIDCDIGHGIESSVPQRAS
jgi:hypothetical protein